MSKKNLKQAQKEEPIRPVDSYFKQLDEAFGDGHKGMYAFFLSLAFFGVMGLIWMIPFPQFDFLVRMNAHTFLNWGSFFIAIVVYLYLKLAPTLSYAALFCIAVMSFFIVQLEYVERDGGPTVILICSTLAIIGLVVLWILAKKERNNSPAAFFQFLSLGPIWLWSKVFDKFKWKY